MTFTWSPHRGVRFRKKLFLCILINKRLKNDRTRFKMSCILTSCRCVSICITEQAIFVITCWIKSFLFFTAKALVSNIIDLLGVYFQHAVLLSEILGVWRHRRLRFLAQNPHQCFCCRKRCLSQTFTNRPIDEIELFRVQSSGSS